jgi:hypothetical protein
MKGVSDLRTWPQVAYSIGIKCPEGEKGCRLTSLQMFPKCHFFRTSNSPTTASSRQALVIEDGPIYSTAAPNATKSIFVHADYYGVPV